MQSYWPKALTGQVPLFGVNNSTYTASAIVPLTTVHQPKHEQGQKAARALLNLLNGILLEPELVVRESTRQMPLDPTNA